MYGFDVGMQNSEECVYILLQLQNYLTENLSVGHVLIISYSLDRLEQYRDIPARANATFTG